jgi:hypothetical protein
MGVFVAERHDLVAHHARISALADARGAAPAATPRVATATADADAASGPGRDGEADAPGLF